MASPPIAELKQDESKVTNRGTGAGGANTNKNGKAFEKKTDIIPILLSNGFIKKDIVKYKIVYYTKSIDSKEYYFFTQGNLKKYLKMTYKKDICRYPDEAMLIKEGDTFILKILEKKNQNCEGSVIDKLCNGGYFIKEYTMCLGDKFNVEYSFCLSKFLRKKYVSDEPKFIIMRKLHTDDNIKVYYGDDSDYFNKIKEYFNC